MTQEDLQRKYNLLALYVLRMRSYQMKYYKYKAAKDNKNMLRYQAKVDKMLANDVKVKESKQLELI
ncbi:hypothetical protein [Segetibacter aerophilus]|uniref:Uncharacterized protein n=1 Tax=Segetibacter aerophilus TaxID=670293 RepID=A0A512B9T9_9BACT|nr:hypothetical protein [Segetibacter aerophilus]GEO08728.1 hypothetical protein SAE01_12240 [Segetibacter aerophilus]